MQRRWICVHSAVLDFLRTSNGADLRNWHPAYFLGFLYYMVTRWEKFISSWVNNSLNLKFTNSLTNWHLDFISTVWTFLNAYGPLWSHMVLYCPVWSHMDLHGPVWSCMVSYGHVWSRMVPYGPVWSHRVPYGSVWSCMVLYGSVCSHIVRFGLVWSHMITKNKLLCMATLNPIN